MRAVAVELHEGLEDALELLRGDPPPGVAHANGDDLRARGAEVVVGTCPDLGALVLVRQPLRRLASQASRRLAVAQRSATIRCGGHPVSLSDVAGARFVTQPEKMFALDRFHPSSAGYRRTAKAMLPSVLAALGYTDAELPFGHHGPVAVDV